MTDTTFCKARHVTMHTLIATIMLAGSALTGTAVMAQTPAPAATTQAHSTTAPTRSSAAPARSAVDPALEAEHTKEDIKRHRQMAAAHEAAAKCQEAGTDEDVCNAALAKACKGIAYGKYCGMKHPD